MCEEQLFYIDIWTGIGIFFIDIWTFKRELSLLNMLHLILPIWNKYWESFWPLIPKFSKRAGPYLQFLTLAHVWLIEKNSPFLSRIVSSDFSSPFYLVSFNHPSLCEHLHRFSGNWNGWKHARTISEENLRSNSDGGRHLLSNYWSFLHDWKSDCWMGNLNKMSLNVVQNTWKSQGWNGKKWNVTNSLS